MMVRTIRFFSRASVVGADQTVLRFDASRPSARGSTAATGMAASCAAILASTSATCVSALFQRASSSPATSRLAGSAASYFPKARSGGVGERAPRSGVAAEGRPPCPPPLARLLLGGCGGGDCAGTDYSQQRILDG